jgi:uncharacterized integral membrane protein
MKTGQAANRSRPFFCRAYNAHFREAIGMKLVGWLAKLGFFLLVLWFALKNTTPVPVRLSTDVAWHGVPLILVMLVCVAIGALLGALTLALPIYRMRREVARLRSAVPTLPTAEAAAEQVASAARQSGAVAELGAERR